MAGLRRDLDRARGPREVVTRIGARRVRIFLAGACLFFVNGSLAWADDPELDPDRIEFVIGNATFVALHEFAHAVIEDFEVTLTTRSCGSPDAYWDGNTRELVACYELIAAFYQLSEEQSIKELEEKIRTFHRDDSADAK
jgi:hypothetical protein